MASSSLGTLTLDLAVRLSEFTDGLTRAERQARDSASNISDSVSELRDNIADDISKISGSFAGMAIGSLAVAAGAMAAFAIETAKADVQLGIMAGTANTSLKSFQVLTHAAAGFGVEQEALAAILADTQEKLGEFSATGGGGAADFFEALQNNTKMTDEQIRELGKTLQSKDGVGAIQYLKDELDALGATSQEQRFVFESLAGDLGNLMPLFADGGRILEEYGVQLTDAGVIKTQEAIEQSRRLAAQTQAMQTQFEGLKTQLVAQMIPALSTLIDYFGEGSKKSRGFKNEVDGVSDAVRITTGSIIGLAASVSMIAQVFQGVGAQMRAIGQTTLNFVEADGVIAKSKALVAGTITMAGLASVSMRSISDEYDRAVRAFEASSSSQQKRLTGLAATYYDANNFLQSNTSGLAINTVEAEANAKAEEALAKAKSKTAKAAKGSTKEISNQMMVYKAWRSAGLSDNQARIITAEVGRENDYQSKYLFGGHSDPKNNKYNLGMISWQKERGEALHKYLKELGLIQNGQIVKTQEALNAQAMFALKEMTENSRFDRTKKEFLSNPDVGYDQGTEVLGNNYIAWRYKDPKYASHHGRRDKHYSKLNAELGSDSTMKLLQAENKAIEDAQRAQVAIVNKYATAREKIELDHANNVAEIKKAYAEGTTEYAEYMAREEVRYNESKNASLLAIAENYLSEEQQIHDKHQKALKQIEAANIEDDTTRQMFIDVQNAMYQKDLDNFRFAAGAKAREQDKLYQSIANSMKANRLGAASTGLDSMAQRTMSEDDYSVWRLGQDRDESFNSVNNQYKDRESEINARDERGEFELPELERFELLEIAKQEHMDAMWAMDQDYALKQQSLDEQLKEKRVAIQENAFGLMTDAAAMFFGENSKMHKAAFAMEKAYAVQKALMNIEETYSNTFNAISAIPLVGPYLAMPMAIAASAMQIASAAGIQGMAAPSVSGIAHGGLDYVPKESTYLLDKGERVLSPKQNQDLNNFMKGGDKSGLTINNYSSARVTASDDGKTITIEDVRNEARNEIKRSWTNTGNPNSFESKQLNRNIQAPRRR